MNIDINDLAQVRGIGPTTIQRIKKFVLTKNGYTSTYNPQLHLYPNSLNLGDCLDLMSGIPDQSIDMILADLPYGITQASWDNAMRLDELWLHYNRVTKPNAAIVLTCYQPFTTFLIQSNLKDFKYTWVVIKSRATNHLNAHKMPMRNTEDVAVFYRGQCTYNPQMTEGEPYEIDRKTEGTELYGKQRPILSENKGERFPLTTIEIKSGSNLHEKPIHPTQKPVELFEYLIRTYTNEGDLILDNTAGVYTSAIAAINTGRKYICIEINPEYHKRGKEWVELTKDGMDYRRALKLISEKFLN